MEIILVQYSLGYCLVLTYRFVYLISVIKMSAKSQKFYLGFFSGAFWSIWNWSFFLRMNMGGLHHGPSPGFSIHMEHYKKDSFPQTPVGLFLIIAILNTSIWKPFCFKYNCVVKPCGRTTREPHCPTWRYVFFT